MTHLLEKNKDFANDLRDGFKNEDAAAGASPAKGLEFALQGAKLFVQRKANVISLRIDTITK
jgi:hypothetical protein